MPAFFASLPGANVAAAKSDFLPHLVKTSAMLPEGYPNGFRRYQTVNRADINQVRYLYANAVAIKSGVFGFPQAAGQDELRVFAGAVGGGGEAVGSWFIQPDAAVGDA